LRFFRHVEFFTSQNILVKTLELGPPEPIRLLTIFLPRSGTGWTCNVSTVTCTRADVLAPGNSYPPITLTVNIGNASTTETNLANVSGGGETITSDNQAFDVTTIVQPGIDLGAFITTNQLDATLGQTGVTFTTNVVNFGSADTSGTVTLAATLGQGMTATDMSGTGWSCTLANLTCTRNDVLPSAGSYPSVTVTFNVSLNAPLAPSSVSVTVSGGGTDTALGNNTRTIQVNMGAAFGIASGAAPQTVPAGTPAKYVFNVFGTVAAGTITFSCSGLPAASTCSFNPPSLTNDSIFVTMTINTTARGAVINVPKPANRNPWFLPELLLLAAMAGWSLKLLAAPGRRRRLVPILGVSTLLLVGILSGCGGGSTPTTITNTIQGTPAGTYAVTFTATSTIGTATRTVNLVVQ